VGLVRIGLADSNVPTDYAAAPKNAQILALVRRLDAALKLDPNYAPAYVERGRLLLILGSAPGSAERARPCDAPRAGRRRDPIGARRWRCSPPESQRRR